MQLQRRLGLDRPTRRAAVDRVCRVAKLHWKKKMGKYSSAVRIFDTRSKCILASLSQFSYLCKSLTRPGLGGLNDTLTNTTCAESSMTVKHLPQKLVGIPSIQGWKRLRGSSNCPRRWVRMEWPCSTRPQRLLSLTPPRTGGLQTTYVSFHSPQQYLMTDLTPAQPYTLANGGPLAFCWALHLCVFSVPPTD